MKATAPPLRRTARSLMTAVARSLGRRRLRWFHDLCADPEGAQRHILREILDQQRESQRARSTGLDRVRDPESLRSTFPLSDYETHRPWIDRMIESGDASVMFTPGERLLLLALTSGSEAEPKRIPVTTESHSRYKAGWMTWVNHALRDHPYCFHGQVMPIVSPPVECHTPTGIPCGSMSGLSTETQSRFVRGLYIVPPAVYGLSNQADKYYALARWSAGTDISFLVTANPSSMLMLAQTLDRHAERLIRDIREGTLDADISGEPETVKQAALALEADPLRAGALARVFGETGRLRPVDIWPSLALLTNWKGGTLGHYLELYGDAYGETPVRDIGLLASEGRMTIPIADDGSSGPLDLNSHFFEFIPLAEAESESPTTLLAHELEQGERYQVVLTNFSGLTRYSICDVVEVTGFFGKCPSVRFLHKGSRFSNITGEKLSEHQVATAVQSAAADCGLTLPEFVVVPVWGQPPCYALLSGATPLGERTGWQRLLECVERHLRKLNIEYECKRDSLRLGHVRLGVVEDSLFNDLRLERIATSGGRSEQYTPTYLSNDLEHHRNLGVREEITVAAEGDAEPLLVPAR